MGNKFCRAYMRLGHKNAPLILALFVFGLSACAVHGGGEEQRPAELDNMATYSAGSGGMGQIAPQIAADSGTVLAQLNALSADKSGAKRRWHNTDTGSSGFISAFAERRDKGTRLCRLFEATRDSYDGSAVYSGKACKYGANPWQLQYLSEN